MSTRFPGIHPLGDNGREKSLIHAIHMPYFIIFSFYILSFYKKGSVHLVKGLIGGF